MPQPRRPRPGGTPPPKPPPRRRLPPVQTPPELTAASDTAASAAAAAALAGAIGAFPGATAAAGGLAIPALVGAFTAAQFRRLLGRVSALLTSQAVSRRNDLDYYIGDAMRPVRIRVTSTEVRQAARMERARESTFRQRQRVRVRLSLAKAGREPDPVKRAAKIQTVISNERRYSQQRDAAIAARAAGAASARNVRDQSPEGAVWQLGHRKEHCPGCAYLHGHALTWRALVDSGYLPPVGPGCGCELVGLQQAWLMNAVPERLAAPTDAESFALIAMARALGHPHGHDGGATMIGAR